MSPNNVSFSNNNSFIAIIDIFANYRNDNNPNSFAKYLLFDK